MDQRTIATDEGKYANSFCSFVRVLRSGFNLL